MSWQHILLLILLLVPLHANPLDDFRTSTRRQELINEAEAERAKPTEQLPKALLPSATSPPQPSSTTTYISRIDIRNNTLLPSAELYYIRKPFENQLLSASDIFRFIQTLQNAYTVRGYTTTRVSLLPSDDPRILIVSIVEGRIGRLYTPQNTWFDRVRLWQLFPINANDIANDYTLRIGLSHVNRLSTPRITTQLEPGITVGETNILTTFTPTQKPWTLYASFNNVSSHQLTPSYLQLSGSHLLHVFDAWKLSYSHTINPMQNANSITLTTSIPLKRHLLSATVTQLTNNHYTKLYSDTAQVLHGTNQKMTLNSTYTLHTTGTMRATLIPSIGIKTNKSSQDGVPLYGQYFRQTVAGMSGTLAFFSPLSLTASIGFDKSVPWFNATVDDPASDQTAEHYQFEKWSATLRIAKQYHWPLLKTIASSASIHSQIMNTITQTSEHAILGGWYSVKGFNSTPKFGECHVVFTSEHMIPLSQYPVPWLKRRNIQLSFFGDGGIVFRPHGQKIPTTQSDQAYAIGGGLGIGFPLFGGQYDFKVAHGIAASFAIPGIESSWSWTISF